MTAAYVVTGTLTDGRNLLLDETLPASTGKVRVTVEVLAPAEPVAAAEKPHWREVMERIWAEQDARGHVPMTVEEVEAYIKGERDSWGDE